MPVPGPLWEVSRRFWYPYWHWLAALKPLLEHALPDDIDLQVRRNQPFMERCRQCSPRAQARAQRLLLRHLTAGQRRELARYGYFHVRRAWRLFRIDASGIVKLVTRRQPDAIALVGLCYHPQRPQPVADVMLSQKLLLAADWRAFWDLANQELSIELHLIRTLQETGYQPDAEGVWTFDPQSEAAQRLTEPAPERTFVCRVSDMDPAA